LGLTLHKYFEPKKLSSLGPTFLYDVVHRQKDLPIAV